MIREPETIAFVKTINEQLQSVADEIFPDHEYQGIQDAVDLIAGWLKKQEKLKEV